MACDQGLDKAKEFHKSAIEKYGWVAHLVTDDERIPTGFNAHTHGFDDKFKHPDIQIVLPIDGKIVNHLFHTVANLIKEGETFGQGELGEELEYSEILMEYKVRFILTTEDGTSPKWVDGTTDSHIVLRMILPSPNGSLYAETMDGDDIYKEQERVEPFIWPE